MDAGSYTKEIVDIVANKSDAVFEQMQQLKNWEEVEINYTKYQVTSMVFKQFNQDKKYRLVIMRRQTSNNQIDSFMQDTFKYRTILTNTWESTEKDIIIYYKQRGATEKYFDVMNNNFAWKRMPF